MSDMRDIKNLINAVNRKVPKEDGSMGDLVHKSEVNEELKEISEKSKLVAKMGQYNSADDLISDFTINAVKRTIMEMEHGRTSSDRLKAAESILNRGLGKPVERIMNLSAEVNAMADVELDNRMQELLAQLGLSNPHGFKANDPNAAVFMDTPKSDGPFE